MTYILLRLEDVIYWGEILTHIMGSRVNMVKENETKKKENIGGVYDKFKKEYRMPIRLIRYLEENEEMKFYNTKEEREEYINRWRERTTNETNETNETNKINILTKEEYEEYERDRLIRSEERIILNHYKDEGCICDMCNRRRSSIVEKLSRGEEVEEYEVKHEKEYNEMMKKRTRNMMNIIMMKHKQKKEEIERRNRSRMRRRLGEIINR